MTCERCGASIEVEMDDGVEALATVKRWDQDHRCEPDMGLDP